MTLPDFMRSDPDGKLATLYKRVKTASAKSKLPAGKNRHELAKSRPVTDEYANVKAKISTFRRPSEKSIGKQWTGGNVWNGNVRPELCYENTQNASISDYGRGEVGDVCRGVGNKELGDKVDFELDFPNSFVSSRSSIGELNSIWTRGIDEVQNCKTSSEVFASFAKTYRDVLERVNYAPKTVNCSSQTVTPKLRRDQMSYIYAGPWEICTWRQNRGMQTEDTNLTFLKQPALAQQENSSELKPNRGRKHFGWKHFFVMFFVSALILSLMEILNQF